MEANINRPNKKKLDLHTHKQQILNRLGRVERQIQGLELHLQQREANCLVLLGEISQIRQELKRVRFLLTLSRFRQCLSELVSGGYEEAKCEELLQLLRRHSPY